MTLEIKDTTSISGIYSNLGSLYLDQEKYDEGLKYNMLGLGIDTLSRNPFNIGKRYLDIAVLFLKQDKDSIGLEYLLLGNEYAKKAQSEWLASIALGNLGIMYTEQGEPELALKYTLECYEIMKKYNEQFSLLSLTIATGNIYSLMGKQQLSLQYFQQAYDQATEQGYLNEAKLASENMYRVYKKTNNYRKALEMHEIFFELSDSMFNDKNNAAMLEQEVKFEYETKRFQDSLTSVAEKEQAQLVLNEQEARLEKERTQKIAYGIGGGLALLLAILAAYAFVNKKKDNQIISDQKKEVEQQKEIIEETHKEITDSIAYAKRIQRAILPPDSLTKEYLGQSFILYVTMH